MINIKKRKMPQISDLSFLSVFWMYLHSPCPSTAWKESIRLDLNTFLNLVSLADLTCNYLNYEKVPWNIDYMNNINDNINISVSHACTQETPDYLGFLWGRHRCLFVCLFSFPDFISFNLKKSVVRFQAEATEEQPPPLTPLRPTNGDGASWNCSRLAGSSFALSTQQSPL